MVASTTSAPSRPVTRSGYRCSSVRGIAGTPTCPTRVTGTHLASRSTLRRPETALQHHLVVFALDTKRSDAFLILGPTDTTYIQISGDQNVGFHLEYQESDAKHHYRAKRGLTADEIVKALVAYSIGADEWKTMAEWELVNW
jgi:hypothetical protein